MERPHHPRPQRNARLHAHARRPDGLHARRIPERQPRGLRSAQSPADGDGHPRPSDGPLPRLRERPPDGRRLPGSLQGPERVRLHQGRAVRLGGDQGPRWTPRPVHHHCPPQGDGMVGRQHRRFRRRPDRPPARIPRCRQLHRRDLVGRRHADRDPPRREEGGRLHRPEDQDGARRRQRHPDPAAVILLLAAATLWHPPKPVDAVPPKAPFTFLREDRSGTQPKLFVRDAAGLTWNVKFGFEVHNESFCWRIVQACGYFAEPSFYIAEGKIENYRPLSRPAPDLQPDGHFKAARFQFRDAALKFESGRNWRWDRPPYAGTKELSGLKVLIMLFSNWDNKDGRVGKGGPNTAEFELHGSRLAAFTDWGSGMGKWGSAAGSNSNWNCADYTAQTPAFVKGVARGAVLFGWSGAINKGFKTGITPAHVAWLMQSLGKVTDDQLREWLKAAGGSDADAACFTTAIRNRIEQLRK